MKCDFILSRSTRLGVAWVLQEREPHRSDSIRARPCRISQPRPRRTRVPEPWRRLRHPPRNLFRPVKRKYSRVRSSTGKKPQVAPYSGAMLAMVARSAKRGLHAGSKELHDLPTTPCSRSISTIRSVMSVAVYRLKVAREANADHVGCEHVDGLPSMTASASIPPTPQPSTPSPLTIVV